MDDLISRQAVRLIESDSDAYPEVWNESYEKGFCDAINRVIDLPSAQPEQTKMIKEIRKWINSGNRGSADYFIVDKIEEIINKYE